MEKRGKGSLVLVRVVAIVFVILVLVFFIILPIFFGGKFNLVKFLGERIFNFEDGKKASLSPPGPCINLDSPDGIKVTKSQWGTATQVDFFINDNVLLCPGTYNYDDQAAADGVLIINANNVELDCNGAVILNSASPHRDKKAISITNKNNVLINYCNTTGFGYGVYASSMTNSLINSSTFFGFNQFSIYLVSSSNNRINNINATSKPNSYNSAEVGIRIDRNSKNNIINNSFIYDTALNAIYTEGNGTQVHQTKIVNSSMEGGDQNGAIRIHDSVSNFIDNVNITRAVRGIVTNCAQYAHLGNNVIKNVNISIMKEQGIQIRINCTRTQIDNAFIFNATKRGISIEASNVTLNNSMIYNTYPTGLDAGLYISSLSSVDLCGATCRQGPTLEDILIQNTKVVNSTENVIFVRSANVTFINVLAHNASGTGSNIQFSPGDSSAYISRVRALVIDSDFNDTTKETDVLVGQNPGGVNNVTFLNSSFNSSSISAGSYNAQFTVKWWLDVLVRSNSGRLLENADVNVSDTYNFGTLYSYVYKTDLTGRIAKHNFTEFIKLQTGAITYFNNYTVNVSILGYEKQGRFVNISSSRTEVFDLEFRNVTDCYVLPEGNAVYRLIRNINSIETCVEIDYDNVHLMGNGYWINHSRASAGVGVRINAGRNVTVRDAKILEGGYFGGSGILSAGGLDIDIINNSLLNLAGTGIKLFIISDILYFDVINNNITLHGNNAHGILADGRTYGNITNNSISVRGNSSNAIYIKEFSAFERPRWHNISLNNIRVIGNTSSNGIFIKNTEEQSIIDNIIFANTTKGHGIYLYSVFNSNITDNFVNTSEGAVNGNAIYLNGTNYTRVEKNIIMTNASNSVGIFIGGSNNTNITNNIINSSGYSAHGIFSYSSFYSSIINNSIINHGQFAFGLGIEQSSYNNISNNNISAFGMGEKTVSINSFSNYVRLLYNNLTGGVMGSVSAVLVLYDNVAKGFIYGNNILGRGARGIVLEGNVSNFLIKDNSIFVDKYGLYFTEGSNLLGTENNTFININSTTNIFSGYPLYLANGYHNFSIYDSFFHSRDGDTKDFYFAATFGGGYWNMTNVTNASINNIQEGFILEALLGVYWYVDSYATQQESFALSNVNISAFDRYYDERGIDPVAFSKNTKLNGRIPKQTVLDFQAGGSSPLSYTYYSNYTFNATALSGENLSQSWNLTTEHNLNLIYIFGNTPPKIIDIYRTSGSPTSGNIPAQSINPGASKPVTFGITVQSFGGVGRINGVRASFTSQVVGTVIGPNTCTPATPENNGASDFYYSCTININYFDAPGLWDVKASVQDSIDLQWSADYVENFVLMSTRAINHPASLSWGALLPNDQNKYASLQLDNTGNDPILDGQIQVTPKDLWKDNIIASPNILASLMTVNIANPPTCGGFGLLDSVNRIITGALLSVYNGIGGGRSEGNGIETLHYCITTVPSGLPAGNYQAADGRSWQLTFPDFDPGIPASLERFYVRDSAGTAVAYFGSNGDVVLKGGCSVNPTCTAPANNAFVIQDSGGNTVAYIDESGNMCIEDSRGGACADSVYINQVSCDPTTEAFVVQVGTTNMIYIDFAGRFCAVGKLYTNQNTIE